MVNVSSFTSIKLSQSSFGLDVGGPSQEQLKLQSVKWRLVCFHEPRVLYDVPHTSSADLQKQFDRSKRDLDSGLTDLDF